MAAYERELEFTIAVLGKMRLSVHLLHPDASLRLLDEGFRGVLGMELDYDVAYRVAMQWSDERTVYKVLDQFMCNYVYFHLPATPEPTAMVIGPYLTIDPSREMILEQSERLGLAMDSLERQSEFYASLPVFNDPSPIMAVVTALGEKMWGGASAFDMVDVNYEQQRSLPAAASAEVPGEQADILQQMKQMEERYAYENELMDIVARGLTNKAEVMMSSVSQLNYQQRLADPLRNIKNYCIICNTLLRKAAQKGGVHPLHLDRLSGRFARAIETMPTLEAGNGLIGDMIRAYCRLVRTHSGKRYSAIVQKTITYIEANLAGNLSLQNLAQLMEVTPSYLSSLFHRETGQNLNSYVTDLRMRSAMNLLQTTRLQVGTVAQLVGVPDANYFTKLFRRCYGVTPSRIREDGNPAGR